MDARATLRDVVRKSQALSPVRRAMKRCIIAITIRGQRRNFLTALVAMLVVTLVMGVTACAPTGTSRSPAAARVATVLRIWYGTDDPTERAWSQDLARR